MKIILIAALFFIVGVSAQYDDDNYNDGGSFDDENNPEYPLNILLCQTIASYVQKDCVYNGKTYCSSCTMGVDILKTYCNKPELAKLPTKCQEHSTSEDEHKVRSKIRHEKVKKLHRSKAQDKLNKRHRNRQYYKLPKLENN